MPHIYINGNKINYNIHGNGKPLILLHNGFYSTQTWDSVRDELSKIYTVVDYDRFGYGKSDKYKKALNGDIVEIGVNELEEFVNKLNISDFYICGHCLGGAIGLKYAINHPERILKIIAESTGFYCDHKMLVKADFTFQKYDNIDTALKNKLINMHGKDYSKIFWDILRGYKQGYIMNKDYNILNDIKNIKCPVLIINGDRDFYFDVPHTLHAYKKIKNSQLCILPGTGHDPHMESRDDFLYHIIKFLKN
jgi:pimeloyl-ACP methyl ester carboxylesterase